MFSELQNYPYKFHIEKNISSNKEKRKIHNFLNQFLIDLKDFKNSQIKNKLLLFALFEKYYKNKIYNDINISKKLQNELFGYVKFTIKEKNEK